SHEPLLESIRGGQAGQSVPNKNAKPAMEFRPGFAFGAKVQMCAEVVLFLFAESSVEEEVRNALYIVTKHPMPFRSVVTTARRLQLGYSIANSSCCSSSSSSSKSSSPPVKRTSSSFSSGSAASLSPSGSSFFLRPFVSSLRERILAGSATPRMYPYLRAYSSRVRSSIL